MSETIERTELIIPGPAQALAGLLGVEPPTEGGAVPLMWHCAYLLERPAQRDLGPDGHPAVGGIPSPPEPGRRRMFAGARVRHLGELRIGAPATRRSTVRATTEKTGSSGRLTFVTVGLEISQDGEVVIDEEQDIVYRDAVAPPAVAAPSRLAAPAKEPAAPASAPVPPPVPDEASVRSVEIDPVLLFRFSAITYNAHRIHYDRAYTTEVEGYPGLVVHGPLQALLMAEQARGLLPDARGYGFDFRLVSPLFDHEGLDVVAAPAPDGSGGQVTAEIRDASGRVTARATLTAL